LGDPRVIGVGLRLPFGGEWARLPRGACRRTIMSGRRTAAANFCT